jgi:hypothetical protein
MRTRHDIMRMRGVHCDRASTKMALPEMQASFGRHGSSRYGLRRTRQDQKILTKCLRRHLDATLHVQHGSPCGEVRRCGHVTGINRPCE